jgi:serine acetyltransferase
MSRSCKGAAPRIGNDVFIGSGARILGAVTIGDGATVAANTLVITDVPAGATIIGVPGRVLPLPRSATRGATGDNAAPVLASSGDHSASNEGH